MKTITDFELCEALKTFDPNLGISHAVIEREILDVLREDGCIDAQNHLTATGRAFIEDHGRPYRACKDKRDVTQ